MPQITHVGYIPNSGTEYYIKPTADGAVKIQLVPYTDGSYEASSLQPGTSADGYNVKVTGGMFGTVTTSNETLIKNRTGNSGTITAYLTTDGANGIILAPGESIVIDKIAISNIFLDTDASFGAMEYVDITLFG